MTLLQFPLHPSIAQRCSVLLECAGLGFCAIRHPLSVKNNPVERCTAVYRPDRLPGGQTIMIMAVGVD